MYSCSAHSASVPVEKKKSKEEHKQKCLEGMNAEDGAGASKKEGDDDGDDDGNEADDDEFTSDEDDAEYFRLFKDGG